MKMPLGAENISSALKVVLPRGCVCQGACGVKATHLIWSSTHLCHTKEEATPPCSCRYVLRNLNVQYSGLLGLATHLSKYEVGSSK